MQAADLEVLIPAPVWRKALTRPGRTLMLKVADGKATFVRSVGRIQVPKRIDKWPHTERLLAEELAKERKYAIDGKVLEPLLKIGHAIEPEEKLRLKFTANATEPVLLEYGVRATDFVTLQALLMPLNLT